MLLCAISVLLVRGPRDGLLAQLERATPERAFAPRLSITTQYRPCKPVPAQGDETVSRETCGTDEDSPENFDEFIAAGESTDPDELRASALATVIWTDEKETASLTEAITRLEKALRLSRRRVPLFVDLSAVHLVRAERTDNPQDLMAGLHYAREALATDPSNAAALFNAALALQALALDEQAAAAWDDYLKADTSSGWFEEVRWRKRSLITQAVEIPQPAIGASAKAIAEFGARYPQEARQLGWDRVLGDWGKAVEEGAQTRADSLLDFAERLGHALELRTGGDASLTDAVGAIRAAESNAAATKALAQGHRAYAVGQAHFHMLEHNKAFAAFDHVVRAQPPSPVLLQWTAIFQSSGLEYRLRRDEATAALRLLLAKVDGTRHPTLEGRARMSLATLLLRNSDYPQARAAYSASMTHFERAGETELMGAASAMLGETAYEQGDSFPAYRSMHRASRMLRPYRKSRWLHNHLIVLTRSAILDELQQASVPVLNEDLSVAKRVGPPYLVLETLLFRARAHALVGDSLGVAWDLDSIAVLFNRLTEPEQLEFGRAALQTLQPRRVSAAAIDSAVDRFAADMLWLVPALMRRADAHLAEGNLSDATADLDTVTRRTRALSRRESNKMLRNAMMEQARSRFDRLVMLHVRAKRPREALQTLERGRTSFAPARDSGAAPGAGSLAPPKDHVALEYALIGDTLLIWAIDADSTRLWERRVNRNQFLLAVEQTTAALESSARTADARPHLRSLYDWLIRPVRDHLGPPETPLVILADGEIAGVPFAALLDSARNKYLVQDHSLRFAATLADAARPPSPLRLPPGPPLLVANPDFDEQDYPTLDGLDGARVEVDSLRGLYSSAVVLADSGATLSAFTAQAQAAGIVHYAGHAVFDDARPERSFLVLAGADTAGRLTAEAVTAMQLRGVRLVVLSACRTLRARGGRSGGFDGLSGALLTAGAGGVVGSLWKASDELTQPLMVGFHREYLKSGDPARALRQAQLQMLGDSNSDRSSPAAWAGFRYAGS